MAPRNEAETSRGYDSIVHIREATLADAQAIETIYAPYVLSSTCTMQLEPGTLDERREWLSGHGGRFPVLVAEQGNEVIGWASLSPYHRRPGYSPTVEDSVYLNQARRGEGIGRALLGELVARGERAGHCSIIAMIAADQPASLRLHEMHGFEKVAHLRRVGFKLGVWLDVVFMQRMLG
jgi:L-amino acid N-acyltransferase